jgi:hypothetical protein
MTEQNTLGDGEKDRRDSSTGTESREMIVVSETGKDELKDLGGQTGRHVAQLVDPFTDELK